MKYHMIKFLRAHQDAGRTFKKGEIVNTRVDAVTYLVKEGIAERIDEEKWEEQKRKKEEAEKKKLESAQEEIVRLKKELESLKRTQRVVEKARPKSSGQIDLDDWIEKDESR